VDDLEDVDDSFTTYERLFLACNRKRNDYLESKIRQSAESEVDAVGLCAAVHVRNLAWIPDETAAALEGLWLYYMPVLKPKQLQVFFRRAEQLQSLSITGCRLTTEDLLLFFKQGLLPNLLHLEGDAKFTDRVIAALASCPRLETLVFCAVNSAQTDMGFQDLVDNQGAKALRLVDAGANRQFESSTLSKCFLEEILPLDNVLLLNMTTGTPRPAFDPHVAYAVLPIKDMSLCEVLMSLQRYEVLDLEADTWDMPALKTCLLEAGFTLAEESKRMAALRIADSQEGLRHRLQRERLSGAISLLEMKRLLDRVGHPLDPPIQHPPAHKEIVLEAVPKAISTAAVQCDAAARGVTGASAVRDSISHANTADGARGVAEPAAANTDTPVIATVTASTNAAVTAGTADADTADGARGVAEPDDSTAMAGDIAANATTDPAAIIDSAVTVTGGQLEHDVQSEEVEEGDYQSDYQEMDEVEDEGEGEGDSTLGREMAGGEGRWTSLEHEVFLQALQKFGKVASHYTSLLSLLSTLVLSLRAPPPLPLHLSLLFLLTFPSSLLAVCSPCPGVEEGGRHGQNAHCGADKIARAEVLP